MKMFIILTLFNLGLAQAGLIKADLEGTAPFANPPVKMTQATCTTMDVSAQTGSVKQQVAESCYAYAASELINFEQKGEKYSAVHLAMSMGGTYSKSKDLEGIEGLNTGRVANAVKHAMTKGMCPEAYQPTNLHLEDGVYRGIVSYYNQYKEGRAALRNYCYDKKWFWEDEVKFAGKLEGLIQENKNNDEVYKRKSRPDIFRYQPKEMHKAVSAAFPTIDENTTELLFYRHSTPAAFIKAMSDFACPADKIKKIEIPKEFKSERFLTENNEISEENRLLLHDNVNQALGSGQPVTIDFFTKGLIKPLYGEESKHGKHSATITGREWKGGKCVYTLKNSWGPDWNPIGKATRPTDPSKKGYFEITEQDLMEHAYGFSYFKK